jgi:XTP/dITP diphosphohydrolase
MMKVLLATSNTGKLNEMEALLKGLPITLMPPTSFNIPVPQEKGLSFIENALIKARHGALLSELPCIADDSGIAVDALGGAPGIYSARYAGKRATDEDNIKKLLQAIDFVPDEERQARFHCAIAYVTHAKDPIPLIFQGQWEGIITREPRGTNGFGYDPVFFIPELNKTAAELTTELKNKLSHRSIALAQLIKHLSKQVHHVTN